MNVHKLAHLKIVSARLPEKFILERIQKSY